MIGFPSKLFTSREFTSFFFSFPLKFNFTDNFQIDNVPVTKHNNNTKKEEKKETRRKISQARQHFDEKVWDKTEEDATSA